MYDGTRAQSDTVATAAATAPLFCIVVPMRNAAGTIRRTVTSLQRQRGAPPWEALLVDDGSTDDTVTTARRAVGRDPRFRFLATTPAPATDGAGVSVARNIGLQYATAPWVVFLDADDALPPRALAAFSDSIAAPPHADVHVGRTRWIDARGLARPYPRGDLSAPFATLARQSAFALHSAAVRRALATGLGGFDPGLRSSEDWDFWMRAARTGAAFATLDSHVADYHATTGSLSRDVATLARNHLSVLARGAQPDPRVPNAAPAFAEGLAGDDLAYHQLTFLLWSGARAAVAGLDPVAAFAHVHPAPEWDLDPDMAAALMADAMLTFARGDAGLLRREWPRMAPALDDLLTRAFPAAPAARVRGLAFFAIKRHVFGAAPWGPDEIVGTVVGGMRRAEAMAHVEPGLECVAAQVTRGGRVAGYAVIPAGAHTPARRFATWAREAAQAAAPRLALDLARHKLGLRGLVAAARVLCDPHGYGLRERRFDPAHIRTLLGHRLRRAVRAASTATLGPSAANDPKSAEKPPPTTARDVGMARPIDVHAGAAWDAFFDAADPWSYDSAYEVEKYAHALSLLPETRPARALELACAEGHFTQRLAPHVEDLVAVDIAQGAIDRARTRVDAAHVRFVRADLFADALPEGPFDVIFCAEVLYYARDRAALTALATRLAADLAPGGRIILTHANLVGDDPNTSGFDWGHEIGAATVSAVFAETPRLALAHEISTPLYRVQAFVRGAVETPTRVSAPITARLSPAVARDVMWDGAVLPRTRAFATRSACATPILMYHRVTDAPVSGFERYAVTPETFAAQMRLLRRHGFWTPTLAEWGAAIARGQPLPGRPVIVSFDDGYVDFARHAWPILKRNAMGASLFVVTEKVGGVADWDGVDTPLLDWADLATLRDEGLEIGAHGASHTRLTRAPIDVAAAEGARARATLQARLGLDARLFCYPHGGGDCAVRAVMRAGGYTLGVVATPGVSTLSSDPMALPRIEVDAGMSLDTFAQRLGIVDGPP